MTSPTPQQGQNEEELPFVVELWRGSPSDAVERVLAKATTLKLANAILKSAELEYPDRRLTLRNGEAIISDVQPRTPAAL